MSAADWEALISAGASALSLVYAALGYHRPPVSPMPGEAKSIKRRFSIAACLFALIATGSTGYNYYDRHAKSANNDNSLTLAYQADLLAKKDEIAALKQQVLSLKAKLAKRFRPMTCEPTAKACQDARNEEDLIKKLREGKI